MNIVRCKAKQGKIKIRCMLEMIGLGAMDCMMSRLITYQHRKLSNNYETRVMLVKALII